MKVWIGTEAGWFVDKTDLTNVKWKSSNSTIATVDNNGKVTGIREGTTSIIAQYNDENTLEYEIEVTPYSEETLLTLSLIAILLISCIVILVIIYRKRNKKTEK